MKKITLKSKIDKKCKINFFIFIQKYMLWICDQGRIVQQPLDKNEKYIKIPALIMVYI